MFKGIFVYLSAIIFLSGCVVGQQINMEYKPSPKVSVGNGSKVKTSVQDERAEVKSGKKEQPFIGSYRGGFGNTFDVSNYKKLPLAEQIAQDLKAELMSLGFAEASGVQAQKTLDVKIKEWSFDGYINAEIWYNLQVSVLDASGKILYTEKLENRKDVPGSAWTGVKGVLEREVPELYKDMIRKIITNNSKLLDALK